MDVQKINSFWDIVIASLSGLWRILDESKAVRRILLIWGFWIQAEALTWAYGYASASNGASAGEKAAVIGAILGVVSVFFGAVVKFYNESRMQDTSISQPPPQP